MRTLRSAAATLMAAMFLFTASVAAREIPAGAGASAGVMNAIPSPHKAPATKSQKRSSSKTTGKTSSKSKTSKKPAGKTSKKRAPKRSRSGKTQQHRHKPAAKSSGATAKQHQG